jgi:hypothetical protein
MSVKVSETLSYVSARLLLDDLAEFFLLLSLVFTSLMMATESMSMLAFKYNMLSSKPLPTLSKCYCSKMSLSVSTNYYFLASHICALKFDDGNKMRTK